MSMNTGSDGVPDAFAGTGTATVAPAAGASLPRGEIGLLGVLMPGLAQVAPAFNLFFTTGLMAAFAGASVPLVFADQHGRADRHRGQPGPVLRGLPERRVVPDLHRPGHGHADLGRRRA